MASSSSCRIDAALDCIGDHCTLGIIHELSAGPRRTLELFGAFKGLSTKTLAARLKKLERHKIISRKSYPESPPRVEYSLTEKGRELLLVLEAIAEVASRWKGEREGADREGADRATNCRACAVAFIEKPRERDYSRDESEVRSPDQKKSRKLTDVTLL